MNGSFKLAGPGLLAGMVVVWVAALVGVDRYLKPSSPGASAMPEATPLSLRINHLCCTGCLDDVTVALQSIAWLKDASIKGRETLLSIEQAEGAARESEYEGWVDLKVPEITHIDFVEIDRVLRNKGLVASGIVVRGLPHIRFVAEVRHLCCGMCKDALEQVGKSTGGAGTGGFTGPGLARIAWIDSVMADRVKNTLTIYPRYEDAQKGIDVAELLAGLDRIGLPPFALRLEEEMSGMHASLGRAEVAALLQK